MTAQHRYILHRPPPKFGMPWKRAATSSHTRSESCALLLNLNAIGTSNDADINHVHEQPVLNHAVHL